MKTIKHILLTLLLTVAATAEVGAKQVKSPHMYLFGFSASFQDSTVYITDIQDVEGAWYDSKTKFLLGRDSYSYQLKEHLTQRLGQHHRVCLVFFAQNKRKAEKQYLKLKKKYVEKSSGLYDVQYISAADFKFEAVDFNEEEASEE